MKRDHRNPARSKDPQPKKRAPEAKPLPIRLNACPSCNHNNVAIERVQECRVCGTAIPPPWHWTVDETYSKRKYYHA